VLARAAAERARGGRATRARARRRDAAAPYLCLLPALAFLGLFLFWPLVQVVALSFFRWNMVSPAATWVGWDNYAVLLREPVFRQALVQSVWYVALALVGNFLLPVGLAGLTLQVSTRRADLYQSLLFAPTMVATSVGALIWQWIYLPTGGLLNGLLGAAGFPAVNWLNEPATAATAVAVVASWKTFGFNYLVALAGLRALPKDLLEAARVDGAVGFAFVRSVVAPLLAPTLLFVGLTAVLQSLSNVFIPIDVLTRGGPSESSTNLLYKVYRDGFQFFQVGKASAGAVVTMLLFGGFAVWQFRLLDRSVVYDR